ncbi:Bug family tripartite tricarboxylate transporter substrate binding protein [Humitalea sp. 24SJ18S-53]|uniref:Bug family tripartite tricarboxylate transporter substrate binding protein n=1 Tax=Humitalea sp. 24SJ18S-53 TaxID=3422307 RepID=UPI003D66B893
MMRRRTLLATAPALLAAPAVYAQGSFPSRPVRMIVGFPPGGTTDIAARLMAQKMQPILGQPVIVENRTGAGGNIGSEYVVRAAPDGYTVLLGTIAGLSINPSLYSNMSFDPQADLAPISRVAMILNVLAIQAQKPWRDAAQLIAASKAAPLTFASSGAGGAGHLAGEQLNVMAGVQNIHVPYRGGAPLITDLMTGQVDFAFTPASGAQPQAETGRLRLIAVPTATRSRLMPELPTVAEAGLPGFDMTDWSALMAPRGVPAPIMETLIRATRAALTDPDLVGQLAQRKIDTVPTSPEELAAFIKAETDKWTPIIRASGATAS